MKLNKILGFLILGLVFNAGAFNFAIARDALSDQMANFVRFCALIRKGDCNRLMHTPAASSSRVPATSDSVVATLPVAAPTSFRPGHKITIS